MSLPPMINDDPSHPTRVLAKKLADVLLAPGVRHGDALGALMGLTKAIALAHPCCHDSSIDVLEHIAAELRAARDAAAGAFSGDADAAIAAAKRAH